MSAVASLCAWCGEEVVQPATGRPRIYCDGHRQAAYQSRKREADRRRRQATRVYETPQATRVYETPLRLDAATRERLRREVDRRRRLRLAAERRVAA